MDDRTHVTKTEARGATTPHMTRYILPISLGLVAVIFGILLLIWR